MTNVDHLNYDIHHNLYVASNQYYIVITVHNYNETVYYTIDNDTHKVAIWGHSEQYDPDKAWDIFNMLVDRFKGSSPSQS